MKKKTPRKARKSPARRRPSTKKRARKSNPTKKRAASRKRASRRTSKGRHLVLEKDKYEQVPNRRRAKRKSNPSRRRSAARRRSPARRRPSSRRKSNPARRRSHRKSHARKGYARRRSNPAGGKLATMGPMDLVITGVAVIAGFWAADVTDRFVATMAGQSTTAFHNDNAQTQISAPPDAKRLGAQAALSVASIAGAYYLWKKGYKKAAEFAAGFGVGAGAHAGVQVINDKVLPSIVTATTAGEMTWKTRLYPDLQKTQIDAMTAAATAARTKLANSAAGAPRAAVTAARQPAGPQGTPRVTPPARPAASTVGCGIDAGMMAQIASLKAEIERLKAGNSAGEAPDNVTSIVPNKKKNAFA